LKELILESVVTGDGRLSHSCAGHLLLQGEGGFPIEKPVDMVAAFFREAE
jgi:hypothetical protein